MRSAEEKSHFEIKPVIISVIIGSLFALAVSLMILLAASAAVIWGIISPESTSIVAICACLVGAFTGALLAIKKIKHQPLLIGAITGLALFVLFILIGLIFYFRVMPQNGIGLLLGTVGGGALAGVLKATLTKKRHR